jgi:hypothetical protein
MQDGIKKKYKKSDREKEDYNNFKVSRFLIDAFNY